uniref:Tyrosine specific protein phosphatases domain-containing protein n=1 Tax=Ananas comosus var. bracteatus TaxID=296719 RepID=A0A6V7PQH6_ANACO|nr:unnamed protein product [Ananas comosus var. bracteatus]
MLYQPLDQRCKLYTDPPYNRRGGGGGCALVHCVRGSSCSAAIVIAYLMWRHAIPFDAALRRVKAARAAADPNLGFTAQLLRGQPLAGAAANSPGSARHVLRLAPHTSCAPLHLVPKTALPSSSSSSASAAKLLDSRNTKVRNRETTGGI